MSSQSGLASKRQPSHARHAMSVPRPSDHGSRERGWAVREKPRRVPERIQQNAANGIGGIPPAAANDRPGPAMPSHALPGRLSLARYWSSVVPKKRHSRFSIAGRKGKNKNGRRMRLGPGQADATLEVHCASPPVACGQILAVSGVNQGWQGLAKGWQGTSIRRNLGLWAMQETLAAAHWSRQPAVEISSEPQLRIS